MITRPFQMFAALYWFDYLLTIWALGAGLGRELNPFVWAHDPWSLLLLKMVGFLIFSAGLLLLRVPLRVWPIAAGIAFYALLLLWNLGQIALETLLRARFG